MLTSSTPLKFLMPGWFAPVMGLTGLALAWLAAQPLLGEVATAVALITGALASLVFGGVLVLSVIRWQRYPQALADDLKHPVRHAFVAALPVSMLLLSVWLHALGLAPALAHGLWWLGSGGQFWATVWILGRWLSPLPSASGASNSLWPSVTPVLFIPVVGNVVALLAGDPLGYGMWACAQFGIGLLFWPILLTLLLTRRLAHGPLPERLYPTWFIAIAPPSIIGLVVLHMQGPIMLAQMLWGMALFTLIWVLAPLRHLSTPAFSMAFWSLSFPLAAFTAFTLRLAHTLQLQGLQTLAVLLLAASTLVVLALGFATVRGLREGSLLAPEPIATLVPTLA